jgi:hypothetical protein
MIRYEHDVHIDGEINAKKFIKENGLSKEFLKADGSIDLDVLKNSTLSDYIKISVAELESINKEIEDYYKRVTEDAGDIEDFLSVSDFLPDSQKTGIVIRNITTDEDGIISDIKLDFLQTEDIPMLPTSKIINYNAWASLEW